MLKKLIIIIKDWTDNAENILLSKFLELFLIESDDWNIKKIDANNAMYKE